MALPVVLIVGAYHCVEEAFLRWDEFIKLPICFVLFVLGTGLACGFGFLVWKKVREPWSDRQSG